MDEYFDGTYTYTLFGSNEISFSKLTKCPKTNERLTSILLYDLNRSLRKIWLIFP
ncbi:hypothetical protein [Photorhabdus cinerea]|uniref:hypothetical protein n=1 Tax=Photorhabdus cinerea TaxID=471575 RepID=UPI003BB63631